MTWENFGDCSIDYGQIWINGEQNDNYAECVEIYSGSDIGLGDNQYQIETGSIYFSPNNWNAALETVCYETYGPPEFLDIAYAFYTYQGFDRDPYGFRIVQVGKTVDDRTARGTTCDDPDVVLHGNASIEKYIEREYL